MTLMKRSFFGQWNSLLASLLLISPLMGSYQDTVEKSFPTDGVGLLKLDFEKSSLNIDTYDGSDVKISIARSLKHGDKKAFEKELDRLELNFNQSGNDISAELKYKNPINGILGLFGGGRKSLQFMTTVRLPRHFNLDAGTSGGAIHLKNLTGKVSLRTSGGVISVNKVTGDTIARTSGGGITVGDSHGAMNLRTSGGRIKANGVKGHLNARTSGGGIHVGDHSGNADVSTSGGSIELGSVKGNITASTSGGSIQAVMVGQPDKDCSLRTSGGSIHLKVSPDANLRIDASTSGGGVKSNLTLSNPELKRSSLQGQLNSGGPTLKARTSGGSIQIHSI